MGYDGGMTTSEMELRQLVADYYMADGEDFDAKWALEHGGLFNVRGWCFGDMSAVLRKASLETRDDGDGEYDIVPLGEIARFTDAYKRFSETEAGARVLACEELDCDWIVGNADTEEDDGYGNRIVIVSPEKMVEAKHAVGDPEVWKVFERLMDERWRITQVGAMAPIVDLLRDNGVEEIGWYESY